MKTTKQLIESLEKVTGKKVNLKEESQDSAYILQINDKSILCATKEVLVGYLKSRGIASIKVDEEAWADWSESYKVLDDIVYLPINKFVDGAVDSGETYMVYNPKLRNKGDDYADVKITKISTSH